MEEKSQRYIKARLAVCRFGCFMLSFFALSLILIVIGLISFAFLNPSIYNMQLYWKDWSIAILVGIVIENIIFWSGIIAVYLTSQQLGIKWRIIGILCGLIPIVHLIVLHKIIGLVQKEIKVEKEKVKINEDRKKEEICKTKYPILLVHGVFFRDFRYFNYWGRIPKQLELNGAKVFYGNQQSASSVAESGKELALRIKQIVKETGCEKVNIIAHSKGGLDSRYAISMCGVDQYVSSLTTINTPHRGCEFADYLLSKIPESQKEVIASTYNAALKKVGDSNPNFIAAVTDLTASACKKLNEAVSDKEAVYYQSVGSKLNVARGGRFPLNLTNSFVKYFDGANDGLVGEESFPWGEHYEFLTVKGKRGISHGDMIDLNRENFDGFDVREFFVQLVANLKKKGH